MYRHSPLGQLSFESFCLPFGGHLNGENRWVQLAEAIPWESVETDYAQQFSERMGSPAKSFRLALGTLIIKEKLGTSDRETIEQIRENPYLQYFLGFSSYQDSVPLDASMLTHFRQRISMTLVSQVNERVVQRILSPEEQISEATESVESDDENDQNGGDGDSASLPFGVDAPSRPPNQGQRLFGCDLRPGGHSLSHRLGFVE